MRPRALSRFVPWVALLALACAHTPRAARVEMDPLLFVARSSGRVEVVDPVQRFEEAGAAYQNKRYADAVALYDALAAELPESRFSAPALYNAGLALEAAGDAAGAQARYRKLIARGAPPGDVLDAQFRLGGVMEALKSWAASAELFAQVLERTDLTLSDRIEAQARRGVAQLELGDLSAAERTLRDVVALARAHESEERLDTDYYFGMATYFVAEIAHRHYRALPIRLPEKQMAADFEARARLLLVAQARYLETMRVKNPDWATAAGFQIASLYREFYEELVGAPVPPGLTGEAREVYDEEVRKQVRPLLEKAATVHERNVMLGERTGMKNDWVRRSNEELSALRSLLAPGKLPLPARPPPPTESAPPLPRPTDEVKPRVVL